jgi:predicted Zn finger-like uncharacterized protein
MTLATRCSSCGTSFRVVQDQLRMSGGLVRCGRCQTVFNAIEQLYDVESPFAGPAPIVEAKAAPGETLAPLPAPAAPESPPAAPAAVPVASERAAGQASPPSPTSSPAPLQPAAPMTLPALAEPAGPPEGTPPPPPADEPSEAIAAGAIETPQDGDHTLTATFDASAAPPSHEDDGTVFPDPDAQAFAAAPASPEEDEAPSFMRQAAADAKPLSARQRMGLRAGAAVLGLTLALQAVFAWRDRLAALGPGPAALLGGACEMFGCRVEAPRRIDALTVESSGLVQVPGTTIYRLSVVLRNRGPVDLLQPAIELNLNDSQGGTLARRVLTTGELGSASRTLAAGAELTLMANLNAGDRRVVGYTIEIFYP